MITRRKSKESDLTKLFEFYENADEQLKDGLQSLNRLIPSSQTTSYTHGIHTYTAKYIPQYPSLFIRLLTKKNDIVLDPMCGSGTTLIESILNGRNALGVDINPLSRLISKVASTSISNEKIVELQEWYNTLKKPKKYLLKKYNLELIPNHNIWFRDDVLRTILYINEKINEINDIDQRDIAKVSLSRIVKVVSNADPRDIMPEINHEKPINDSADAWDSFSESLTKTISKINKFNYRVRAINDIKSKIIGNDARKINLKDKYVDLIVTSPPYAYAMDYARIHKLSLFTTLELDNIKLQKLSKEFVGTDKISVKDSFNIPDELNFVNEFIDELALKNKRRSLCLKKYLIDMYDITKECFRVLKTNGHMVYVIGNSTLGKSEFSSSFALQRMGELVGFKTKLIHDRPYYVRSMGEKRAKHSAVTKSDIFIIFQRV